MRIISGKFKGKKLLLPNNKITRPLKDMTKESIFNLLQHTKNIKVNLINLKVLDIFAGVGSFGLECLSRGAKKVFFIENLLTKYFLRIIRKEYFKMYISSRTY